MTSFFQTLTFLPQKYEFFKTLVPYLGHQFLDKLSQNKVDYSITSIIEIKPFNSGEFLG